MKSIPFTLLFVTAAILGAATFVEDARGTAFVREYAYATWWFKALWMLLAASAAVVLVRRRMWRRPAAFVLHAGLLVVFAGALLTAFTGHKGLLHLRQGEPASSYVDEKKRVAHLPFVLTLDSFRVEYYAGTSAPSDYVSQVACHDADGTLIARPRISMNRIFSAEGYRFYQSSFDEDLKGSWLTVNHDPYGTAVAYTGFLLICIGSLGLLLDPRGGFRRLLRHPLLRKGGLFALLCLLAVDGQAAEPLPVVRRAQADSLAARQVMYNDRVAPLNTLCRDFVQKVYGRSVFRGLSPEQVVASWMLYPEEWNRVPIIRIKNRELRERLGIRGEYATLAGLFDGTTYKLQPLWQQEMGKHSQLGRAIQETDEKAGLALMLTQGTLVRPLPPGTPRLSEQQVRAELLYNRIPFNKILFMANLTLGFVAIGLFLYRMLKRRGENRTSRRLWTAALWLSTLFHAAGYMLRGYVSGRLPLNNGYETMQFVALVVLLTACLLERRFPFVRPFGFLLSGFTLLVAHLGEMNPQITPLMPVLASPWLSWHVSLIMISYALFAFICLNGLLAAGLMARPQHRHDALVRERVEQLTLLSRLLLYPSTFLLGIGILLGSVWANVSWGSYWSWDPKEVWALVAFMVYGAAFHRRTLPWLRRPLAFHLYMVAAFLVVLMTYFGVNYLLGGMHSYANPS